MHSGNDLNRGSYIGETQGIGICVFTKHFKIIFTLPENSDKTIRLALESWSESL